MTSPNGLSPRTPSGIHSIDHSAVAVAQHTTQEASAAESAHVHGFVPGLPGFWVSGEISHGGSAVVYRGTQLATGRKVAIKALSSAAFSEPDSVEQFAREASILAQLHDPRIVDLITFHETSDTLFMVLELCEGPDLLDLRTQCPQLPYPVVVCLASELAKALWVLHAAGFSHGDLKPANVILLDTGHIKLIDLGSAVELVVSRGAGSAPFPATTPGYCSPERALGRAVDERSDLFSLGILLAELLFGARPSTVLRSTDFLSLAPAPPAQDALAATLPPAFLHILRRLLAFHPAQRYTSEHLLAALEPLVCACAPHGPHACLQDFLRTLSVEEPLRSLSSSLI